MDGDRELQLLLLALRDRVIDPARLAEAAGNWSARSGERLMSYLAGRGVIAPDDLHRLEAVTIDVPAAVRDGDPSLQPTPLFTGDGDATTDHPARGDTPEASGGDAAHPGARGSGRYQVLRLHQTGGLGQVWLARDTAVGREVALKTLRPERAGGAQARSRFLREARVTGRLEHPGIVPLYDLAGGGDEPFYVMRFVSGRTLAEAAGEYHRRRAAGTAGPLDLNALLDAFINVCRAVAFAHSRDVLHRDLKGQNVVVGEYGETFLLDWGLAKSVGEADDTVPVAPEGEEGESELTAPGAAVGTPAYMAPEVAAGGAATKASDVYGLGAILYALLAGHAPYRGPNAAEVLKQVVAGEPPPVAAANPAAPPALVAVCRRAMARDPAARYPSADAVATEVRRWLADEPVEAYREPLPARAARWARRRKTAVVAAGVLLATTAVASTAAAGLVWKEQQETKRAWQKADGEKERASENADAAIVVVRDLGSYVNAVESTGGRTLVNDRKRKEALDSTLRGYERLLVLNPEDHAVRENVGRMYRLRANLSRFLNDTAGAVLSYREASRHYGELAAVQPKERRHRESVALTKYDFALFLSTIGRLAEASANLNDAVGVYEEIRRSDSSNSSSQRISAHMQLARSELDYLLGRFADSEQAARNAAVRLGELAETPGTRPEPLDGMFRAMAEMRMAMAQRELGRIDEALSQHDASVDRLATLAKLSSSRDVRLHHHQARAERARTLSGVPARRDAAMADLDESIRGCELLAKEFPDAPSYVRYQALGRSYRGRLKTLLGQRDAAEIDLSAAAKALEALAAKHTEIPVYGGDLGRTYIALGQNTGDVRTAAMWYGKAHSALTDATRRSPENALFQQSLRDLAALAQGNQ